MTSSLSSGRWIRRGESPHFSQWRLARGRRVDIEYAAAVLADAPAGQPLEQHAEIEIQQNDRFERLCQLDEQLLERLGLRDVARESRRG
jgi:hypothetical protein